MLAPISLGRRDKGTSFRSVCKYVTKERDPNTGDEKNRGEVLLSENLLSLNTAHLEMRGIAAHNPLCKDPVYHFQITWHPGEQPSQKQWEEAALQTLADLGFAEHQYLVAAHHDREHFHIHIVVNKVHPESYRAHSPYRDMYALDQAMRELEHKQGWVEDVGLYRWDKQRDKAVMTTREERHELSRRGNHPTGKAAEVESFRGGQSLQTYAQGKPASDLQMLLARHGVSWADVHRMLRRYGLEMHRAEHGGYTVHAIESDLYVKASDVFRRAFSGKLNRGTTEAKLGPWRDPLPEDREGSVHVQKYAERPRDTDVDRQRRREQREQARLVLKRRFGEYRALCRGQQKTCTNAARQRHVELMTALKETKHEIRARAISWSEKRVEISQAVAENVIQCRLLSAEAMRERLSLAPLRYEDWVIQEANRGNEAAAAQLRGWRYQDQRLARRATRNLAFTDNAVHLSAGSKTDGVDWQEPIPDGRLRDLKHCEMLAREWERIRYKVDRRTGDIQYLIDGKTTVVDRGRALSVFSADETAVVFALEVAVRKYGRCLAATGTEEWKQKVAQIAARNDVALEFTDRAMQTTYVEEQLRLGKATVLKSHFSRLADSLRTAPEKPILFLGRTDTLTFLESLWSNDTGNSLLADVERGLAAGEVRRQNLKGICELSVSKSQDGHIAYALYCLSGKSAEAGSLLVNAAIVRQPREPRTRHTAQHSRFHVREVGHGLE